MTLVATHLTTAGDIPSGSTTYVTASISPSPNALVLAWVASEDIFGTPTIPTASGCNLTWEQIDTVEYSANCRLTLFRALGASPTTGPVTFTFPGSEFAAIWTIAEWAGASTSGSNGSGAIVQSAQNSDGGLGNSLTVTLGGTVAAGNMVACGWCFNVNDNAMTAGANWTDLATVGIFRPMQILSAYNETGDETATASQLNNGARGGIAVEILGSGVLIVVFDTDEFLANDPPPMPVTGIGLDTVNVEESAFCMFGSPFIGVDTITTTEVVTIGLGVAITVSDAITPTDVVESGSITVQPIFVVVVDTDSETDAVTVSRTATIEVADSGVPVDVAAAAMLLQIDVNDLTPGIEAVDFRLAGGVEVFDSLTTIDAVAGEFNVVLIQVDDELLPSDFVGSAPTLRIDTSDALDATEVTERVFTTHVFLDDLHFINLESARRD